MKSASGVAPSTERIQIMIMLRTASRFSRLDSFELRAVLVGALFGVPQIARYRSRVNVTRVRIEA